MCYVTTVGLWYHLLDQTSLIPFSAKWKSHLLKCFRVCHPYQMNWRARCDAQMAFTSTFSKLKKSTNNLSFITHRCFSGRRSSSWVRCTSSYWKFLCRKQQKQKAPVFRAGQRVSHLTLNLFLKCQTDNFQGHTMRPFISFSKTLIIERLSSPVFPRSFCGLLETSLCKLAEIDLYRCLSWKFKWQKVVENGMERKEWTSI